MGAMLRCAPLRLYGRDSIPSHKPTLANALFTRGLRAGIPTDMGFRKRIRSFMAAFVL